MINSTQWTITEAFLIHDLRTLITGIQSSYASILQQGKVFNIPYHGTILQSQPIVSADGYPDNAQS